MEYTFGRYEDIAGERVFEPLTRCVCDSDAQAEHTVRRICEDTGDLGLTIRRGDVEWFARA